MPILVIIILAVLLICFLFPLFNQKRKRPPYPSTPECENSTTSKPEISTEISHIQNTGLSFSKSSPQTSVTNSTIKTSIQIYECNEKVYSSPLTLPDISGRVRFHKYKIRGKNPDSNRMKSKSIIMPENVPEDEIISATGLLPPITVSIDSSDWLDSPPTERQLNLAKDLNIPITPFLTSADLSCFISKQYGDDSHDLSSESIRLLLWKYNIYTSPYCGTKYALWTLWKHFSVKEKLSFWCYLVYCSISNTNIDAPEDSPYIEIFTSFSEECFQNHEFTKAIISFSYNTIETYIFQKKIDHRYKDSKIYEYTKRFLITNHLIEP